jgi:hypothetical protein
MVNVTYRSYVTVRLVPLKLGFTHNYSFKIRFPFSQNIAKQGADENGKMKNWEKENGGIDLV